MAGLVPAIHAFYDRSAIVDARRKSLPGPETGHDQAKFAELQT